MHLAKGHFQAFAEIISILTRHRDLTLEMARREFSDRYAGQVFGLLWVVAHPLFIMGLYLFVFAYVFKVKVGGTADLPRDYSVYLLSGLVAWLSFQEVMTKSCSAITANASLVKQVVFPLEILPVKGVISSLVQQGVSLLLLLGYIAIGQGGLPWTVILLPILLVLQILAMVGVAYILATVGAYFRDLKDIVQLFATAGVYLMPIFYLPTWVPEPLQPLLAFNPFSHLVWCYQDVLYFGRIYHVYSWVVTGCGAFGIFVIGYRMFRKMKPGLGNLL